MQDKEPAFDSLTQDGFLGQRLSLRQPKQGFRSGHDAVMLAASAAAKAGTRLAELGSGAGVASLCLAARAPQVHVTGIELDVNLVALAAQNSADNALSSRVVFQQGDVTGRFSDLNLAPNQFDEVIANPPYYRAGAVKDLPDAGRQRAHVGDARTLEKWVMCACALVAARGFVSFIHRADALADLLLVMQPRLGGLQVLPIGPRPGAEATRIIVRGRRDSRAALRLLPMFVLQNSTGEPSAAAEAVLRGGSALAFGASDG
ncbi:methyltransferase [bacterium]|nr:methyltransferase [bacterium]